MKPRAIRWVRYRLPLARAYHTAHGVTTSREGLLLRLIASDGAEGFGESSPLPEFGGHVDAAEQVLRQIAPALLTVDLADLPAALDRLLLAAPGAVAVRAGLDVAALDLQGRREGRRMADLLEPGAASSVAVNAPVGLPTTEAAAAVARERIATGFATVKLKVGMAPAVEDEVARVAAVREAIGPDAGLRLDANGAWSPARAIETIRALEPFRIEYIEQPVAAADLEGMAGVRRAVTMPIAADESVTGPDAARRVIALGAADVLMIKPMAVGGPLAARSIAALAAESGIRAVVTAMMETGIGVAAALQIAASLPGPPVTHGLATLSMLVDDLTDTGLPIVGGRMAVPEGPGLGLTLDEDALVRYALNGWQEAAG